MQNLYSTIPFIFCALSISAEKNLPVTVHFEESSLNSLRSDVSKNLHIAHSEGKMMVSFFKRLINKLSTMYIRGF